MLEAIKSWLLGNRMIRIKTEEEIELIRESALMVSKTLGVISDYVKPGVKFIELDRMAEEFIKDHNGVPAFKGYRGFPNSLCISVNEAVVHGIPTHKEMIEGDIVSVDCGVLMNGFYGDSAYTYAVGEVSEVRQKLLERTKTSLYLAIEQAVDGNRIGDISYAVQTYAESFGYGVVRELVGHGVGKELHEKPEVPNFGVKGRGVVLKEGMTLAIEPMINMGKKEVYQHKDKWTILTKDHKPSAHFEHTIVVRKNKAEILSSFEYIKQEKELNG